MQLDERRRGLALAALALLGTPLARNAQAQGAAAAHYEPATVDSGLLWYQESDGRVRDAELIFNIRQPLPSDRAWNAHLTVDVVCGGSPVGAIPSKTTQTFVTPTASSLTPPVATQGGEGGQTTTGASGGGGDGNFSLCTNPVQNQKYTVAPGALPIDGSFQDQRIALSGGYETAVGSAGKLSAGAAISHELDFFSVSVNALFAQDFDSHNTTLSGGFNLESDSISPIGGTPTAWSTYGSFQHVGQQSKRVGDVLLGLSQVMNRRWLSQLNATLERSSGYHTDPYKIVSVVDASGNPVLNPNLNSAGFDDYVYESRPGTRSRWTLFWDNRIALDHDTIYASLRHSQDDWGVRTDTADLRYRFSMGGAGYFEPHWRAYRQSAANFYQLFLLMPASGVLPTSGNISADPRLAAFRGQTIGLKYGLPVGESGELSLRAERYVQRGTNTSSNLPGLQGLDLYPGMRALLLQAGLRFSF
jgi:hypothetical protein